MEPKCCGELVHVDVKKLGKIPAGGGWRMLGRSIGNRNHQADKSSGLVNAYWQPVRGYHFLHTALDGHSRLAYSELLADERKDTAAAFWTRANAWFTECGITVRKVLTDNGSCYRSRVFADALGEIEHRRTRPYRPQTNGKVERFHRTLADEWAYARLYRSDAERCQDFPAWLHTYNHHRGHTALGGHPPASRVPNLSGQYN
jgi:transposase InsO family protein